MAKTFSLRVMPGVTAESTISWPVRKLLRPLDSQGFTISVVPVFSSFTVRLDSQVCTMASYQLRGVRQFAPSMVPPWTIVYAWDPEVITMEVLLATSDGSVFVAQG